MKNYYPQAYSETLEIINKFDSELKEKIPISFINLLEKNKDENYSVKINFSKNINEQVLLRETRILLSLIYRDYLCTQELENELLKKDKENLQKEELKKINKYDIQKKFQQKKDIINEESLVLIKEKKWYIKIKEKLLKLFGGI